MATGDASPVVRALMQAESATRAEIRVHLSRAMFDGFGERLSERRARRVFSAFGMGRTAARDAVLIYVNFRSRVFSVVADEGAATALDGKFWKEFSAALREDLMSTNPENAVACAVRTLGVALSRAFPVENPEGPG